jgi:hypothetical protein
MIREKRMYDDSSFLMTVELRRHHSVLGWCAVDDDGRHTPDEAVDEP